MANTEPRERKGIVGGWLSLARWIQVLVVAVAVALVVTVIVIFGPSWFADCDPGLTETDDAQCVGVSNGAASISTELTDVLGKIRAENEWVAAQGQGAPGDDQKPVQAVSVAILLPMPRPGADIDFAAALRHALEGAHLAQRLANHTATFGDSPSVRLLVANSGERSAYWKEVVDSLLTMRPGGSNDQRLVAVVASGQSLTSTRYAVDALVGASMPVVSDRLTGDRLTSAAPSPSIPLVRVAPRNSDQAAASAAFLKPETATAMLVQDINPEDTYASSLGQAFQQSYVDASHRLIGRTANYNGALPGVGNAMGGIVREICALRPDVVFFAGRSDALGALVQALPSRTCPEFPVRIVTADDAVDFSTAVRRGNSALRDGLAANASVNYTTLAHPEAWNAVQAAFSAQSVAALRGSCEQYCYPRLFPRGDLTDGAAIMGFDAMLLIVRAVRTSDGINHSPELIIQYLPRIHDAESIPGASGWISLSENGEATNKAVPIVRIDADGQVHFVRLSSTFGTPCMPGITVC